MSDYKKLYELGRHPEGLLVKPKEPFKYEDGRELKVFIFHHVDGMYSYCKTMQGEVFHPSASTEVKIIEHNEIK